MQKPFDTQRPWGSFREFTTGEPVTVKILYVRHGEEDSLQYHLKRTEFFHVLSGAPLITIGEKKIRAHVGDEFEIPTGMRHRVSAPDDDVSYLEISSGDFDENDIVREQDDYGRA